MPMITPQPYPAYRTSGVEWLGDMPEHWEVRRLKQLCSKSALYGANIAATQYQEDGVRFLRTTDITDEGHLRPGGVFLSEELVRYYLLKDKDLLISRSGTVGRSFLYQSKLHGPCAYAGYLVRFIPNELVLSEYIFQFTKTQAFDGFLRVMAISSTIENVNADKYANAHLTLPPLHEQAAIVRYLDYVDRRVRRYLRAKEKLIGLLEEEKQAIINQAVTRGLDPSVRLKPSGVEWLGGVPEHWGVQRLKQVSVVQSGITLGKNYGDKELIERPYLRVANVQASHLDLSAVTTVRVPVSEIRRSTLKFGDVLMTEGGDIDKLGRGCVWSGEILDCLHQNHIFAVRLSRAALHPEFLVALMGSLHGRSYFQATAKQTTNLATTNKATLGDFPLLLPSVSEQQQILSYIDMKCGFQDASILRAQRQISLCNEYRTRLIADAVTGKLDVREAAAELPDEADAMAEDSLSVDGVDDDLRDADGLA